jgi:glycosyltransferase involved in cell wall biosynthesis
MTIRHRPTILHLADDVALGGVARMIDALVQGLGDIADHACDAGPEGALSRINLGGVDMVVVHSAMTWTKLPALLALRLRLGTRPMVLIEHSYTEALERELVEAQPRFRRLLRIAYGLADRVVSVSKAQAKWMIEAELLPRQKLSTIPPLSMCGELATLAQMPASSLFHLGASGRFHAAKGFDYLLDAMAMLQQEPVHLTLAGYGPFETALKEKAAELSNVTIAPAYSSVADFLGRVDAVVVPSTWEAYGLLAMEARLAARPVIVSDVDGLTEQVHESYGLVVPPKNSTALAGAIRDMAGRDLRAMGEHARQSAIGHAASTLGAWTKLISDLTPRFARADAHYRQPQVTSS